MNVFVVGTPIETAMVLDKRRLRKQIIECRQILDALIGKTKAWRNHPCTKQYEKHITWLEWYRITLMCYLDGNRDLALIYSRQCETIRPPFHTEEYLESMKRRLFTKDPEHYAQWASLGTSDINWYWSDEEETYIYYRDGKRVKQ